MPEVVSLPFKKVFDNNLLPETTQRNGTAPLIQHPYYFMPGFTYYPPSFPFYPQNFPQNVPMTMFNSQQPLPPPVQLPPQIEE